MTKTYAMEVTDKTYTIFTPEVTMAIHDDTEMFTQILHTIAANMRMNEEKSNHVLDVILPDGNRFQFRGDECSKGNIDKINLAAYADLANRMVNEFKK